MQHTDNIDLSERKAGTVLPVKAVPGARRERIAGVLGDRLKVTVSAAPEKGKANKAIAALLAKALGVSRRAVELRSGPTSPLKDFLIVGLSADQLRTRLREL